MIEDCMFLNNNDSFCIDGRLKKKDREYAKSNKDLYGYSCTNSTDRKELENFIDKQMLDLKTCQRRLKLKCKK